MQHSTPGIQLMRPRLLAPFVSALDMRGLDTDGLLLQIGLNRGDIECDTGRVAAKHTHQFIAGAAKASGERHFSWDVGWTLDHASYPLFAGLAARCQNLSELFTEMAVSTATHASATGFALSIEGPYSLFHGKRRYRSDTPCAQTDAFSAAMLSSLLFRYVGDQWSAKEVTVELQDPGLVPGSSKLRRVRTTNRSLMGIRFPTRWLLIGSDSAPAEGSTGAPYPSLLSYLNQSLEKHIADPELDTGSAAQICGLSLYDLNQALAPEKLTLAKVIDEMRRERARQMLTAGDAAIAEVGRACGYRDATSFSRVFQRWEGQSPRQFRAAAV